jgi:hypothetical protein
MAQSRKKSAAVSTVRTSARSESKKPGGKTASRTTVATVEIVEEEKGLGIDDGIIMMTTIVLLAAFLMLDYHRGKHYGEGMLFKGSYATATTSPSTT